MFTPLFSSNPGEESFSSYKAHVKRELATEHNVTRIGDQSAAAAIGVNLHNWRATILKEIGEESVQAITRENVGG